MARVGTGFLNANNILTDISYVLVEAVVNAAPTAAIGTGVQTVTPTSMVGIYTGAQIIVGSGSADQEVVTTIAATATNFTANFANAHSISDLIVGATFPTCQTNNEFFTQAEMLRYLSEAQNDFLLRTRCVLNRVTQNFVSGQTISAEPTDCIQVQRIAVSNYATPPIFTSLREQPQSSLDLIQPNWAQQGFNTPRIWYEDRVALQSYGVWPVPGNAFSTDVLYAQSDTLPLGLADGFLLPDLWATSAVKYGCLAKVFSKDGQQADPARAKFFAQRFELSVKLCGMYMAMMNSPVQG